MFSKECQCIEKEMIRHINENQKNLDDSHESNEE